MIDKLGQYVYLANRCFGLGITFDVIDDRVRFLSPEGPLSPYLAVDDAITFIIGFGSATFHWWPQLSPQGREDELYAIFKEGIGDLAAIMH